MGLDVLTYAAAKKAAGGGSGGVDLQYMHFRTNSTGFDTVILQYAKTS